MLAHDFDNGVALMWILRLLCMTILELLLCRIFLEKQKNYTHPTRNRQFGWGASANFVVQ